MSFSIIIPIYNVEEFIDKAVCSVVFQTFQEFELLLIDDGSVDKSHDICIALSLKYKNIKVFKNPVNKGVAFSRNLGIKESSKDYILFLDSDDYWDDLTFLEKLNEKCNDCDVVIYGYKRYLKNGKFIVKTTDLSIDIKKFNETLEKLVENEIYTSSCCLKAVKRCILIENNILFKENIFVEDIDWNLRLGLAIKSIDYLGESIYVYRERENSRSNSFSLQRTIDYCDIIEQCSKYIENNTSNSLPMYYYLAYQYSILLGHISGNKKLINKMKPYQYLLSYSKNRKIKVIRKLVKLIGFSKTCSVINKWIIR